jgi:Ca-activated chloride channel family protein
VDYRRPDVGLTAPSDGPGSESSFILRYPVGGGFGQPYSPTHSLRVGTNDGMRSIEVGGAARDITILLPVTRSREPAISMIANAPANEDGFALITIAPPAILPAPLPRDITFVVDVSGSMSGRKIEQARDAGKALLATLGARDRFRMIDFSTDVRGFRDGFVPATQENLTAAERYLDGLQAEGSTNLEGALREALDGHASDIVTTGRLGVVLLLTDGEPTVGERDPDALARLAAQRRGARRVFTFGLGADVNASLLEQLALQGRGTASFLRPDEDIERAVSVVATRLRDPVLADVHVHADDVRLTQLLPVEPPDLFAGQSIVLLARYTGHGRTRLHVDGRTTAGRMTWTQEVEFPERSSDNVFIPRLWATQRVGWLSAERHTHGATPEVDAEIRTLGERYGIPTELTSYLVREPEAVVAGRGDQVRGAPQAAQLAAPPGREQQFEAAKVATAMRASQSLAIADSVSAFGKDGLNAGTSGRRVGNRLFDQRADGVWADRRFRAGMRVIHLQAYSTGYFALLQAMPELRDVLALGEHVLVAGRAIAIEIGPDGATELGAPDRAALREAW